MFADARQVAYCLDKDMPIKGGCRAYLVNVYHLDKNLQRQMYRN